MRSDAVLQHSWNVLLFVGCHAEVLPCPPNGHSLDEKLLIFEQGFDHWLFCLCSLKALVSTGGKNVQAACDW